MNTIKFTITLCLMALLLVSCGDDGEKNKCMTLEQVRVLCIAEGIQIRPEPHLLWTVELDCERRYPTNDCYQKQDRYFPHDD